MQSETTTVSKQSSEIGLPKSEKHVILEIVEYIPDSIICKTIIKNRGGKLSVVSFDEEEKFCEKTTKYDTFVQIIDGKAEITMNNKDWILNLGESIIIPVNTLHCFKAKSQFKMIITIIKNSRKRIIN